MITGDDVETIRGELAKHRPARVVVFQGDAEVRKLNVPNTKKRWQTVLAVLAKLEFTRIELHDRAGGLLSVWDAPVDDEAPPAAASVTAREEGLLRLMLAAQKEALAHQRAESAAASAACVQALGVLSSAVESLASVHRATLESQAQAFNAQLQAALATPAADGDGLQSGKLLELLAPVLMRQLMPGPGVSSPAPTNGVKP